MKILNNLSAETLLTQVARMAVQHGGTVEGGAGRGYVGILNGCTIKLSTHFGERGREEGLDATKAACEELRRSLLETADLYLKGKGKAQEDARKKVLSYLKLDPESEKIVDKPLITRKIALDIVKTIRDAAGSDDLKRGLKSVRGEATIQNSRADLILAEHKPDFDHHAAFMTEMEKSLAFYYPGAENEAARDALETAIEQAFVFQGGALRLSAFADKSLEGDGEGTLADTVQIGAHETADTVFTDLIQASTNPKGENFQKALAKLYLGRFEPSSTVPAAEPHETFTMPSERDGATVTDKRFLMMKTIATTIYPAGTEIGDRCFHTTLLNRAAAENHTTIANLTRDQLADYVEAHWDGEDILGHDPAMGSTTTIRGFFKTLMNCGDVDGIRDAQEDRPDKAKVVAALKGAATDAITVQLYTHMSSALVGHGRNKRKFLDGAYVKVGGGLVAKHAETFQYGDAHHQATSLVTPRRKFVSGIPCAQVANLAETELKRINPETGKEESLFCGVRFGSLNLDKREANNPAQYAHYGQLVEAALLSQKDLCASLKDGAEIELPICRVDMSDEGSMKTCAERYKITFDGKTVTVRPKVLRFRVLTDRARIVTEAGGKRHSCLLAKEDVAATDKALEDLLERAKAQQSDAVTAKLSRQIAEYWSNLKTTHGQTGEIELFEGYGSEMMQFGARILLLSKRLGMVPTFNCDGGRDRTGLMDVEVKTLALNLAEGGDIPEISYAEPGLKELRTTVRDKSGNQDIASEIKFNDENMYQNQLGELKRKETNLHFAVDDSGLYTLYVMPEV